MVSKSDKINIKLSVSEFGIVPGSLLLVLRNFFGF